MKFVDTFSGIGGFHLGIKQAMPEAECVLSVELDKHAKQVYHDNFPETPQWDDITTLDIENMPDHDLLVGGFPCQPFSINRPVKDKKSTDENDDRTNLFKYLIKICEVKKPKYVLFENVARLASMKNHEGEVMVDVVCEELRKLGYDVEWKVLDSKNYGVPQQRKRTFIIGSLEGQELKFPEPTGEEVSVRDILEDAVDSKLYAEHRLTRQTLKDGKTTKLDALKKSYRHDIDKDEIKGKITPVSLILGDTPSGISRQHDRLYSIDGISRTLATFGHPYFDVDGLWRMLSPRESARLQGFPEDFILCKNTGNALKQFGNAVTVNVIEAIVKENFA